MDLTCFFSDFTRSWSPHWKRRKTIRITFIFCNAGYLENLNTSCKWHPSSLKSIHSPTLYHRGNPSRPSSLDEDDRQWSEQYRRMLAAATDATHGSGETHAANAGWLPKIQQARKRCSEGPTAKSSSQLWIEHIQGYPCVVVFQGITWNRDFLVWFPDRLF